MSAISVSIPYDVYESAKEMVVVLPLAGVSKSDINLTLNQYELTIMWVRTKPRLKADLSNVKEECYRGDFIQVISLPQGVFFEKIHSHFGADNILTITIPKLQIPEKIQVAID
jgi:HSP20 family molecular chaperone IbpA